ncbi:N-acetylmuramoyl-L-alanine amidase [Streptomyces armeniacus]|uniref:N-acetylmuramoyl-L-alanine amidase n=1 Tax=Streptomyces armeniacus TaxID=83291 RepID=A0A345Y044_9ACTN|nr:N-acetylmuramoyl-L-alanine amidase [Streptomyces armeniacus]AXK37260.1 N-acetylmuramoyl-L-alanine amidase [Streptomyces armeniacus]
MTCAGAGVAAAALLAPLLAAGPAATAEREPDSLQGAFARAAERHDVPVSVLLGVSYLQSRWDGHRGAASVSGGYGPMHLTDARTALASEGRKAGDHHAGAAEDPRGDTQRPLSVRESARADSDAAAGDVPRRLRTLPEAARLTGLPQEELREEPAANIEGGAALLAAAQRKLGLPLSGDPADWYGAVAGYAHAADAATAAVYAGDVFDVITDGAARTTDSGQRVTLAAHPGLRPETSQVRKLGLREGQRDPKLECPRSISCEWIPAPYEEWKDEEGEPDYGNHDKADRPRAPRIDSIVVHDTEETYERTLDLVQDREYVSWHYTLRSSDGHVAQHVPTEDVAWHAGNWYVNSGSVGLEHEGFLTAPDAWYTEAMYRASARLVRHLARTYDIPLDRQHILGHDNVPGTLPSTIPGMHTDPGPYWDWQHYFALMGKEFEATGGRDSGLLTIRPDYDRNQPVYTGCETAGEPCPAHGSTAVRLHTAPRSDAPLVPDAGLHPDGSPSTTGVNDTGARASTGQQYAVAGREGDWTAIWYLGRKAWFHNPRKQPTAVPASGSVVTPAPGKDSVPVYGRAYPEPDAYPEGVPVQDITPLPYELSAGQSYAAGLRTEGTYFYAVTFDPAQHRVVRGETAYYQIQFGHRVAFVKADDVRVRPAR